MRQWTMKEQPISSIKTSSLKSRSLSLIKLRDKPRDMKLLRKIPHAKTYDLPVVLSTNLRALRNKIDELLLVTSLNKADVVCVTESWLSSHIDDTLVALPGYNLIRRDRESGSGRGGVCLYLRTTYPCTRLFNCEDRNIESLQIILRPFSLPRRVSCIILCVIYHCTVNGEIENAVLCDHVLTNLDTLLVKHPNALVIITGDFNPTSTVFNVKDLTHANNIKKMVNFKTRDSGTLEWF